MQHIESFRRIAASLSLADKTGDASQSDMIAMPKTISQDSHSPPSCVSGFEGVPNLRGVYS